MQTQTMILGDFHIHSNYSDGKHTIREIVDFYGQRGFSAIAITDHLCESNSFLGRAAAVLKNTLTPETFPRYLDEIETEGRRAKKQYGLQVIPGVEYTYNYLSNQRSAHFLALGIDSWIGPDSNTAGVDRFKEILTNVRNTGAITIAAHPVSTQKLEKQTLHFWDHRDVLKDYFDAWEAASGPQLFKEVIESGLPILANSDLHRFSQIESWKTLLHCDPNQNEILAAIRQQLLEPHFYRSNDTSIFRKNVFSMSNQAFSLTGS